MALTKISTGGVKDDAASQAKIADEAIDEARLQVSNAGTNGQFLQKSSGTGGLTWATVDTNLSSDTTPQLGGDVDTNDHNIEFKDRNGTDDANVLNFGAGDDMRLYSDGTNGYLQADTELRIGTASSTTNAVFTSTKFDFRQDVDITNSKKLGIGGSYGSSGQVLTSGGSGAAPSWAAVPPAGNTFTAVANGSIANNKCVKLDTDGKVSEIKEVTSGMQPTYASDTYTTNSGAGHTAGKLLYDPDQHKVVSFYTATYGNNNGRYSVMSISSDGRANNGPISGSEDLGIASDMKMFGSYEGFSVCYDTNNNKYIYAVNDRNNDNIYVGAGTYDTSNNSITWPSGKSNWSQPNGTDNDGRIPTLYFDETTNRIVLLMRDDTNSNRPYVVIGTYNSSSGSIDWGTKQVLDTTGINDNNTVVCKGGSGTGDVFVGYRSTYGALKSNLITVSNSSNTCTIQTSDTIENSTTAFRADYNAEDNNILLAYQDTNNNQGKLIRLTKNSGGTGFDKSSAYTFCNNNQASFWDVHYFSTAKKCYVFYRLSASDRNVKAFMVNNTSGTPNATTTVSGSGGLNYGDVWMGHTASSNQNLTTDRIFQAVPNNGRSNRVNIEGWSALQSTNNITSGTKHQYVGYADQAYSDGQTATVITYGNLKSGLSGLTIGTKYYVAASGNLSTSDAGLGTAGVALAADKLLIKDPG